MTTNEEQVEVLQARGIKPVNLLDLQKLSIISTYRGCFICKCGHRWEWSINLNPQEYIGYLCAVRDSINSHLLEVKHGP